MPFKYSERKLRSGLHALQQYTRKHQPQVGNLKRLAKEQSSFDVTEAFHYLLYKLALVLRPATAGLPNELVKVTKLGRLYLNQPVYLPTPYGLKWVSYNTEEVNHRITSEGQIYRLKHEPVVILNQ